jgi:hypothetical protein
MSRMKNIFVVIVAVVTTTFLLVGAGCSNNKSDSAKAGNAEGENPPDDEDPTEFPDPEGDIPTPLASSGLPMPPGDSPSGGQLMDATVTWNPKPMSYIQDLIQREIDADPTQAEIDELDKLYSETPTPPDPGQI